MRFIFVVLAIMMMAAPALAAPYVVCDPNPGATYYVITGLPTCLDGTNVAAQADGSIKLDVACVARGTNWSTTFKACNVWECSTTVPFALTRPATLPVVPAGLRLSQ